MEHTSLFWASFTNYPAEAFLFTRWFKGSFAEDWCKLLICWKIDFSGKFATVQQTIFSNSLYTIFFFSPSSSNFPPECWVGNDPLMETSNCYQSVIRLSILFPWLFFLSLNAGLCSALLTNKTLRRRVEFAPQKLWCIGFFTVRAAPPTAFSLSVVLKTIFSVFAIFTLSLSVLSSSPFRVSFAI